MSNPPFVITPRREGVPEYDYRDGGMVGDAIVESVIRGAAEHLEPGGIAQLLGNWEYRDGDDGLERVRDWAGGLDHWIIEREVQHVTEYAETWIRDGGTRSGTAEFDRLYDAWLDDFEARGVRSGRVRLRAAAARADAAASASPADGRAAARLARVERLHGPLGDDGAGLGGHLADCLAAHDRQAPLDDEALGRDAARRSPATSPRSATTGPATTTRRRCCCARAAVSGARSRSTRASPRSSARATASSRSGRSSRRSRSCSRSTRSALAAELLPAVARAHRRRDAAASPS